MSSRLSTSPAISGRAPHGARGSKHQWTRAAHRGGVSRPARGARIETGRQAEGQYRQRSRAPHGARGSKLPGSGGNNGGRRSRPARGARIETSDQPGVERLGLVAPRTGRADRNCISTTTTASRSRSRPARGARIETSARAQSRSGCGVAPRTGRADRNKTLATATGAFVVAPRTGRADRNVLIANLADAQEGRAPHGARGSKPFGCHEVLHMASSRPARGARIETPWLPCLPPAPIVAPRTGRADRNVFTTASAPAFVGRAPHGARGSKQAGGEHWHPHRHVAPRTGRADRNLLIVSAITSRAGRAPHGARGSKHRGALQGEVEVESRPARGARIETQSPGCPCPHCRVAPRTGRADRNRA